MKKWIALCLALLCAGLLCACQGKPLPDGLKAGLRLCGSRMVRAGQISKIEQDAAYTAGIRILYHMAVGIQNEPVIVRNTCFLQSFFRILKRFFLNVKSKYLSMFSGQPAQ